MAKTYSEKLKDPRWQRKRLEIMQRDEFRCRLCADKDSTLHVHHLRYRRDAEPWEYANESLVTVCDGCHEELHVSKFGESIIEAAVAGRATLEDLHGLVSVFEFEFTTGPSYGPMTEAQWAHFTDGITAVARAVRRGLTWEEIEAALHSLKK